MIDQCGTLMASSRATDQFPSNHLLFGSIIPVSGIKRCLIFKGLDGFCGIHDIARLSEPILSMCRLKETNKCPWRVLKIAGCNNPPWFVTSSFRRIRIRSCDRIVFPNGVGYSPACVGSLPQKRFNHTVRLALYRVLLPSIPSQVPPVIKRGYLENTAITDDFPS